MRANEFLKVSPIQEIERGNGNFRRFLLDIYWHLDGSYTRYIRWSHGDSPLIDFY